MKDDLPSLRQINLLIKKFSEAEYMVWAIAR